MPMRSWRAGAAALWVMWGGAVAAPYEFPAWKTPRQLERACTASLAESRHTVRRLEALDPGAGLLAGLDDLTMLQENVAGPVALLSAVHPAKVMREAAQACERRLQDFAAAFLQNTRVHAALRGTEPADDIDRRFREDLLDAFEDAGVALPPAGRAKARRIARDLARLQQDFERRIAEDDRRLAFTATELDGVPRAVWASAPKDGQGRYRLGLDAPTYQPVVEHATNRSTRERMWRAGLTQGGDANLRTLAEIARLRREQARLLGFASYDDLVLRRRMAHDEATVSAFLASVQDAVARREVADLAVLTSAFDDGTVQRWDVAFLSERVRRERHDVAQEQFRQHFPPEASLDFVFALAGRLFGVRFEAQTQTLWHADARAFTVSDADGTHLGTLFVDLYPRADKYNHAAVWSLNNGASRTERTAASALVVNFNRQGLNLDELETLLHEFGHALHGLLSKTRYASQGGTNVQFDFVEAPSQMFEDWAYDPRVVALFQEVCATCPPVPEGLLARAFEAREFGKGLAQARQRLFASYDQALYGREPADPMDLWRRMESATPLGHVPGSQFPAGFAHIAGAYAAGYYGYLWSLVLAEDLRTAFAPDRLSADTGSRYRREVLSQGGQVDANELMRRFLGRPTNNEAFFRALSRP